MGCPEKDRSLVRGFTELPNQRFYLVARSVLSMIKAIPMRDIADKIRSCGCELQMRTLEYV